MIPLVLNVFWLSGVRLALWEAQPHSGEQNAVPAFEELKYTVWRGPRSVGRASGPSRKGAAQRKWPRRETSLKIAAGWVALARRRGLCHCYSSMDDLITWFCYIYAQKSVYLEYSISLRIWRFQDYLELLQNLLCTRCHGALFYYLWEHGEPAELETFSQTSSHPLEKG